MRAAFLIAAACLAGCESLPGERVPDGIAAYADDPRLGAPVERICFASNIDGFSLSRRRSVVLHEGRDRFLVEVFGACPDLEHAQAIGIAATGGCLRENDALLVTSTFGPAGPGPRRCMIKEIRAWDHRAAAPGEAVEAEEEEIAPQD